MSLSKTLSSKNIVITGAGSGIGRALALQYIEKGANIAISDINPESLNDTVAECQKIAQSQQKIHSQILDVAQREDWLSYAETVKSELGPADMIINNAGVTVSARVDEITHKDFEWIMNINFWGVVHGTQAFLDQIKETNGQIANISSIFGVIVVPSQCSYHSAKFAVRGFTEALTGELKLSHPKVGVTTVMPGGIRTNIINNARMASQSDDEKQGLEKSFKQIALTTPEKAAKIIIKGLEKRKSHIIIGPDAKVLRAISRIFPTSYIGLVAKLTDKQTKKN